MNKDPEGPDLQTHNQNVVTWAMYTALLVIAISIAFLLYWFYQPTDVLKFNKQPIPVRTIRDHPTGGGVVILQADYCKFTNSQGRVRTSFVSSSREVFLPESEDKQPKNCVVTEVPIVIPKDLIPDTYHVHFRVDYSVNPIRHIIEEADSKSFTVVEM